MDENLVFILINNVVYADVLLLQLSAIGSVRKCEKHVGTIKYPALFITAPRDMEGGHVIVFETEEKRQAFFETLLDIISHNANLYSQEGVKCQELMKQPNRSCVD